MTRRVSHRTPRGMHFAPNSRRCTLVLVASLGCANVTAPSVTGTAAAARRRAARHHRLRQRRPRRVRIGGSGQTGICANLQCRQDNCTRGACTQSPCSNGGKTTVSGTVFDPAGKTPLYNVVVYVPNEPLVAIRSGASCDSARRCIRGSRSRSRSPTRTAGSPRAHAGRRQHPAGHADRKVAARHHDPVGRRLHRHAPGAGADPAAAQQERRPHPASSRIANGGSDALKCLLRKIGVETAEFTSESGAGRVNQYAGYGAPATNADGVDRDRHVDVVGQRHGDEGVRHHVDVVRRRRRQRREAAHRWRCARR